jgi:hypothetical protein
MSELPRKRDLALKPLLANAYAEAGIENLDRDSSVRVELRGDVDRRHASASELALDAVPGSEGALEALEFSHVGGRHLKDSEPRCLRA